MSAIYKVLSALLSYPEREFQEAAPELSAALDREAALPTVHRGALIGLIAELARTDLLELQARYVDLFDRTRSLSLHLFEHVHGESRDRGQAMVSLLERYQEKGLDIAANELPDYLPLFLEFLSFEETDDAGKMLAETSHILEAIARRLEKHESRYAAVFDALVALAGAQPGTRAVTDLSETQIDDPNDFAAIDRAWEEAEVRFGPGDAAQNSCPRASEILAKLAPHSKRADANLIEGLEP
jgi:nitrate reductase delta subunit